MAGICGVPSLVCRFLRGRRKIVTRLACIACVVYWALYLNCTTTSRDVTLLGHDGKDVEGYMYTHLFITPEKIYAIYCVRGVK